MPCNGVSVASAKVALENEKYLAMVDQAVIDKVVGIYLANLGYQVSGENGYYQVPGFTIRIYQGRLEVSGRGSLRYELVEKLAELLNGLAGKMRQQVIVQKLAKAGVKVNQNQVAGNGAVVLNVEI
mgnify:CR=1 FL=1